MKRNILIILSLAVALQSCAGFLDVKPAGKLTPETGDVASFNNLLNHANTISYIFSNNNNGSSLPYLCDDVEMSENQAEFAWYNGHPNIDCYFAHTYKQPYGNPDVHDYYWNWGIYRATQYFNTCIDGINGIITPEVEQEGKAVIAQATVGRAWSYFIGALGYGPVYKPNGDNSYRTIPYRATGNTNAPMEDLSTMEEIFQRVSSEIHSQMNYIPEMVSSNTRFGKIQTYAFLAYYHLFTQKYDSVAIYSNKALEMASKQNGGKDNLFFDMNKFSWADPKVATDPDNRNGSSVNTAQGEVALTATYHRENCLYRTSAHVSGTNIYPAAEYLALFDESTDLRREYFFFEYNGYKTTNGGIVYDDGRKILNYQTKLSRTSGYTYPEILLMRAEANARLNNISSALEDLNYLRKLRHKTGTPEINITGQDNVINEIINERRRELPVGSPKRFFDLKRFTNEIGKPWAKESITHIVQGVTYSQKVDSDFFVLPITNEVLRWNPHWNVPLDETNWSNNK